MSSFLLKDQDRIAAALSLVPNKTTRRSQFSAPDMLPPGVRTLHDDINTIKLSSWKWGSSFRWTLQADNTNSFPMEAAAFIRTPRNSDQNAYDTLVKMAWSAFSR